MTPLVLAVFLLVVLLLCGGFFLYAGVLLFTLRRFRLMAFPFRSVLRVVAVMIVVSFVAAGLGVAVGVRQPWVSIAAFLVTFCAFLWMLRRRESISVVRALGVYVVNYVLNVLAGFVLIVPIVVVVRLFVMAPFEVRGVSMLPTLRAGDLLLVDKLTLRSREPQRGDIVILVPPGEDRRSFYVERIVGLPEETISFVNGNVLISNAASPDGAELAEPYLTEAGVTLAPDEQHVSIPPAHYFTMGDNRENANDSRFWGTLPRENIVGVVAARIWPPQ